MDGRPRQSPASSGVTSMTTFTTPTVTTLPPSPAQFLRLPGSALPPPNSPAAKDGGGGTLVPVPRPQTFPASANLGLCSNSLIADSPCPIPAPPFNTPCSGAVGGRFAQSAGENVNNSSFGRSSNNSLGSNGSSGGEGLSAAGAGSAGGSSIPRVAITPSQEDTALLYPTCLTALHNGSGSYGSHAQDAQQRYQRKGSKGSNASETSLVLLPGTGSDVAVASPTDSGGVTAAGAAYLATGLSSARSSASSAGIGSGGEVVVVVGEAEDGGVIVVGQEKRHSHQSVASTESCSSESSVARRARRLAKKLLPAPEHIAPRRRRRSPKSHDHRSKKRTKVPSMSPGAKWRRLRNTLKAAHEMQAPKKKQALSREDSFLRKFSTRNQRLQSQSYSSPSDEASADRAAGYIRNNNEPRSFKPPRNFAVPHDGNFMFNWLGVVTVSVLYNLWTCILREAFKEVQESCHACWFVFDALFDVVYLLDILVQFRTGYLNQGLMVYDSKKLARRYIRSRLLYVDACCLVPLDLLQFYTGVHPMLRFPRFFKAYRTFRFIHMLESRTAYPNLIRVANLTHILFLGAHWFAAFYYMISEAEDFKGKWAYPQPTGEYAFTTRKYLASLFWSTLTLTTIGDLPPPDSNKEYVFVIVSYLIGVFVFATIVGQVGNVINNRNASRQEFERLLDGAKVYMQTHNVPSDLQKRVQRWYDYVWSRGRLNGCDINSLGLLPDKLKTELAIHVNLETLKKVTIFQECQPEFLHDLVLKMKAYIFTPGDLICRRGEVAREMFIIADGVVEIISESGTVLKQMGAGDFFGEIGILNLDGGINRRTADVRSVGYSELFVLSRDDVLAALKDHPDAESIIRDYGQRRLREIEAHRQLVKPLKQMSANKRVINLRNMAAGLNAASTPLASPVTAPPAVGGGAAASASAGGGGGSGGGGGGGASGSVGGGSSSALFTQPGSAAKLYNYCYTSDDPEAHLAYSGSENSSGFFTSVCSSFRRIFHRKVRRQKSLSSQGGVDESEVTSDSIRSEGKQAWMTGEQQKEGGGGAGRMVQLCCPASGRSGMEELRSTQQDDAGAVPVAGSGWSAGASKASDHPDVGKRPPRTFSPSGYTAVLTEEEETSCCASPVATPGQSPTHLPLTLLPLSDTAKANHSSAPRLSAVVAAALRQTVAEVNLPDLEQDEKEGHVLSTPRRKDSGLLSLDTMDKSLRPGEEAVTQSAGSDVAASIAAAAVAVAKELAAGEGAEGCRQCCREGKVNSVTGQVVPLVDLVTPRQDAAPRGTQHLQGQLQRQKQKPLLQDRLGARRHSEVPKIMSPQDGGKRRSSECGGGWGSALRSSQVEVGSEVRLGQGLAPCIRVDSASTLSSACSGSRDSLDLGADLLHPRRYLLPPTTDDEEDKGENNDNFNDVDDAFRRCRSNSAPCIVALALPDSSVQLPSPCATRLSPSGSSVALPAIASPPSASRVTVFQRRLSSWAKLDGSSRHCRDTRDKHSVEKMAESPRSVPWTPATDPLIQAKPRDPGHVTKAEEAHVTSLLLQLQASHAELHSRMSQLEAAYASSLHRLDRLGKTQADLVALLTAQVNSNSRASSMRGKTWNKPLNMDEDMTAL